MMTTGDRRDDDDRNDRSVTTRRSRRSHAVAIPAVVRLVRGASIVIAIIVFKRGHDRPRDWGDMARSRSWVGRAFGVDEDAREDGVVVARWCGGRTTRGGVGRGRVRSRGGGGGDARARAAARDRGEARDARGGTDDLNLFVAAANRLVRRVILHASDL